jgi:hypothetical protein
MVRSRPVQPFMIKEGSVVLLVNDFIVAGMQVSFQAHWRGQQGSAILCNCGLDLR